MDQVTSALKPVFGPLQDLYNKAFNTNKYAAGVGLSVVITTFLFFVMVILISLGDSGIKEDTSVKLADIVMPERQIDTFLSEVDKPDKPEEQPEDIAQPELDLQPLTGIDVSIAKPKANFKSVVHFFVMVNIFLFLRFSQYIHEELKKEERKVLQLSPLQLLRVGVLKMQKQ